MKLIEIKLSKKLKILKDIVSRAFPNIFLQLDSVIFIIYLLFNG